MMPDREKVIRAIEGCINFDDYCNDCVYDGCIYVHGSCEKDLLANALALLNEQETLLHEYEKLSQVCFKIEKYLRIADLSILIDRIEEGKVEVLQDDGRHDAMETTIKIRRL